MSTWDWSTTAGTNQTADANINWQEGQLPSTVNDSARAMMAALKAFVQDGGGYATLAGSGDAFSLTLSQPMQTRQPGLVGFFATRSNTGAVTLQIDSTTAAPMRAVSGTDLTSGQIVSGAFYIVSWNSATSEWIINGKLTLGLSDLPVQNDSTILSNISGSSAVPSANTIAAVIAKFPTGPGKITKAMEENAAVGTLRGNNDGTAATATSTVTISNGSPTSISWTAHGLAAGTAVYFTTTGALPTGLSPNVIYYVLSPLTDSFNVAATAGGSAINTSSAGSGTHTATVPATGSVKDISIAAITAAVQSPSFVYGLKITNNGSTPDTKIDVTADIAILGSSSGSARHSSVSLTINCTTTGANALDTGSLSSSTWYYVYLISTGTAVAGLVSASSSSPTLPAGYTLSVRVGAVRTDGSTKFYRTMQRGQTVQYVVTSATNTASLVAFPNGSNSSTSATTPTWGTVAVASYVPPTAERIKGLLLSNGATTGVAPNNSYGIYTSTTNPPYASTSVAGNYVNTTFDMMLESTNIYYYTSIANGTNWGFCSGWVDSVPAS